MPKLSVAMVAMNEAANIGRTLASLAWADEIVVVDSGSTDETLDIARSFGARTFVEPWKGYGGQVNSALDKCSHPWILNVDADEVATPELAQNIQDLLQGEPEFQAYWLPRVNNIFGRWMRHGGQYPDYKLRLFRKGAARLPEDTEPHATPKTMLPTRKLKGDLQHYQYPTLRSYVDHMQSYSSSSVPLVLRRGRTSRSLGQFLLNAVLNPAFTFLYNYAIRGGFLDGREGLIFHLNHSLYTHWKFVKAWEAGGRGDKTAGVVSSPKP